MPRNISASQESCSRCLNMSRESEGNALDYSQRCDRISSYIDITTRIEELAADTSDLTLETAKEAHQLLLQLNEIPLNDDVDVQEMLLCSKTCVAVPNFFVEKLPTLKITDDELTLDSFGNRLKEMVANNGWEDAMERFDFLRASVSFQVLNPRRQERTVELNQEKKRPQRRAKEDLGPATQPQEVAANSGTDEHNVHVDLVLKSLKVIWRCQGERPVDFWRFVIDPDSFINTVENMFCVNILVNNAKAELIFEGNNKEMFLAPIAQPTSQRSQNRSKSQEITAINVQLYEEKINLYQIREPMIVRPKIDDDGE